MSPADLLSHAIDYGAYCRALEAQGRGFAAWERDARGAE